MSSDLEALVNRLTFLEAYFVNYPVDPPGLVRSECAATISSALATLRKVRAEESDAFDDGYKAGYQEGYSRAVGDDERSVGAIE